MGDGATLEGGHYKLHYICQSIFEDPFLKIVRSIEQVVAVGTGTREALSSFSSQSSWKGMTTTGVRRGKPESHLTIVGHTPAVTPEPKPFPCVISPQSLLHGRYTFVQL